MNGFVMSKSLINRKVYNRFCTTLYKFQVKHIICWLTNSSKLIGICYKEAGNLIPVRIIYVVTNLSLSSSCWFKKSTKNGEKE